MCKCREGVESGSQMHTKHAHKLSSAHAHMCSRCRAGWSMSCLVLGRSRVLEQWWGAAASSEGWCPSVPRRQWLGEHVWCCSSCLDQPPVALMFMEECCCWSWRIPDKLVIKKYDTVLYVNNYALVFRKMFYWKVIFRSKITLIWFCLKNFFTNLFVENWKVLSAVSICIDYKYMVATSVITVLLIAWSWGVHILFIRQPFFCIRQKILSHILHDKSYIVINLLGGDLRGRPHHNLSTDSHRDWIIKYWVFLINFLKDYGCY